MALQRAEILTPWLEVTDEGEISRWPLVTSEFALRSWTDITGQDAANLPPEPNLVALLVTADETVINAIKLDARFFVLNEDYL